MADQTYTVEAITGNDEKPDKGYGPMRSIFMNLSGEGRVEWYTKAATQPPAIGSQLTGMVEDGQYGKKFKKAKPANGFGGGPRPEDPVRSKRILRMHSQDMAIGTFHLAKLLGLEKPFDGVETVGDLFGRITRLADAYDQDVEGTAK